MVRHKGAQPFVRTWQPWGDQHPVARSIASGDRWMYAWLSQACTPYVKLARASGRGIERLRAIEHGDRLTMAELSALAGAWNVDPAQVIASLPDRALLIDGEV